MTDTVESAEGWQSYIQRIEKKGEWRSVVLRDMILDDIASLGLTKPVMMDIGCSHGFDASPELQESLAQVSGEYIGIEPDTEIQLRSFITTAYRTFFEDAPVRPASIDVAFSVMVLEHIQNPQLFWDKVYECLKPGGVFWGLTVDSRHWFALGSRAFEFTRIKNSYLRATHGKRGESRYENYPVYYRTNSPKKVMQLAHRFSERRVYSLHQPGAIGFYFPSLLKPAAELFGTLTHSVTGIGENLIIRVRK